MRKFALSAICFIMIIVGSNAQKKIGLDDLFRNYTFSEKTISGLRSMKDGLHYTTIENKNQVVKYSYKTGEKVAVVLNLDKIENAPIKQFSDYQLSEDETKLLLTTDKESIYRRSFTASYYVWNSVTGELKALSENGKQQVAVFSPDGERVAFVRNNNIFIKNLKFGTESQITRDGKKNEIINGSLFFNRFTKTILGL